MQTKKRLPDRSISGSGQDNSRFVDVDDLHNFRQMCSPENNLKQQRSDSGNISFMQIFAVILKIYVNFPQIYVCLCSYNTGMVCLTRFQVHVFG